MIRALVAISDQGSELISGLVNRIGIWLGIGGGTLSFLANGTETGAALKDQSLAFSLAAEYGGFVAMVAGAVLIIKNITDMIVNTYTKIREDWRKQQEHERAMADD